VLSSAVCCPSHAAPAPLPLALHDALPISAARPLRDANSLGDGWTNPSENHAGTVVATRAAPPAVHHPHRASRSRHRRTKVPGGAVATSARIIPTANQAANAGG